MTTLRPERHTDGPMSYENTGQFKAVVEQLHDPLNDPLPGRPPAVPEADHPQQPYPEQALADQAFTAPRPAEPAFPEPVFSEPVFSDPAFTEADFAEPAVSPWFRAPERDEQPPVAEEPDAPDPAPAPDMAQTARMPVVEPAEDAGAPEDVPSLAPPASPSDGGRAARRKAARQGGGGHRAGGRGQSGPVNGPGAAQEAASAPRSRMEARRAAKAAKDSPAVVASRIIGELFITTGVLMLLFVTYQLWWTNVRAHQQANGAANSLQHQWDTSTADPNRVPGTFSPGQGFAIMYIPSLDVKAPIAQGVSKHDVLDKGMIGHYDGALNTAMPWDKTGNFAVAAHRNTHGEPFRYINHLVPGDKVVVETATEYYTYEITSSLASTPPANTSVLRPVPTGSGFTGPGRYLTLTTCTPEFTSTNRLIVWGKLVEERPRSKGKPDALVSG
ncbi:class E sortase [Streptomyces cocklensis]|uniref:Sortase SrtE1 n=1 Tax=Actinacidiphila cocklensis TaxID=887465 RepID=A0A9W4DNV6_9ACTN|nr:class E sortase [Actinacidiphila cocklensis]MDD1056947.1 class E sortase [Actinacidiphila cocklensis]CAG6393551.1 Sortase SrtE1 [Actinacidiphila cocklensis]